MFNQQLVICSINRGPQKSFVLKCWYVKRL